MAFQPGVSGNPLGRKRGAKNRVSNVRAQVTELLENHGEALMRTAIKQAKKGDPTLAAALLDRLIPKLKPVQLATPLPLSADDNGEDNRRKIIAAMAAGTLPIDDGTALLHALKLEAPTGGLFEINVIMDGSRASTALPRVREVAKAPIVIENGSDE